MSETSAAETASVSPAVLIAGQEQPLDAYAPLTVAPDTAAGSILDFSFLSDAPAGKYGRVAVRGSHFVLAEKPEEKIRFLGANLCFSANFLSHSEADALAAEWRRRGYNSVRIHHFDGMLTNNATMVPEGVNTAAPSDIWDPQALDRLDYLMAAMKKNGIYIMLDLYTIRGFAAGEIPGWDAPAAFEIKGLLPILPEAFSAWAKLAANLMAHRNPYSGCAWQDDPAIIGLCPVNEDTLSAEWARTPELKALYDRAFAEWCAASPDRTAADDAARERLLARFLVECKIDANRRLEKFFRERNIAILLTGSNYMNTMLQTFTRAEFEFVDNHQYWDHPEFPEKPWAMPFAYHHRSVLRSAAETPRSMMPTRIFGKPFTVTEHNYTLPNRHRAEGGAVLGAYAALQDWDGLYRFAWSHDGENIRRQQEIRHFDAATDPLSQLTERQICLFFGRGDFTAARKKYVYPVTLEEASAAGIPDWQRGGFPEAFSLLGLRGQIGSCPADRLPADEDIQKIAAAALPDFTVALPKIPGENEGEIAADNGEIFLNPDAGTLRLVSPRSECLVGEAGSVLAGKALQAKIALTFASLSASAMDSENLENSRRVLLFHLVDIMNQRMAYRDPQMTVLEDWGTLPYLVARGTAEVILHNTNPDLQLFALDTAGRRLRSLPATYTDGAYHFTLETVPQGAAPALLYELGL